MAWSQNELLSALEMQLNNLKNHCVDFDHGNEHAGTEISIKLRVLLHHVPNSSISIFNSLNLHNIKFYSTAQPSALFSFGSGDVVMNNQYFLVQEQIALNEPFRYVPHFRSELKSFKLIDFDDWWNKEVIFKIGGSQSFTRKKLIQLFANKLGGAHLEKDVKATERGIFNLDNSTIGWTRYYDGQTVAHESSPFLQSSRQIAHEVFETLRLVASLKLFSVTKYFEWIAKYEYVLHNNEAKWLGKSSNTFPHIKVNGDYFKTAIGAGDKNAAIAFSTHSKDLQTAKLLDIEHVMIAKESGKVTIKDLNVVVQDVAEYKINDEFEMIVAERLGSLKMLFVINGDVVYESLYPVALPLYVNLWLYAGAVLERPVTGRHFAYCT